MKKVLAIAALSALLAGCTTMSSEVFEIQPGVYSITGENWGTYNAGTVRMDLIKKADEFCKKQGKRLHVLNSSASDAVLYAKSATADVNFRCVDPE